MLEARLEQASILKKVIHLRTRLEYLAIPPYNTHRLSVTLC